MQRLDNDEFDFLHSWIWDRTRAIRKDLRTQRIEQRSDINLLLTCLERSARFLILSTHQMARTSKEDYSHQQDIEQLNQTLMSLKERYVDNRRVGYPSENEAEFWAYRLILAPLFTNTQLENELHRLSSDLRNNPRVKTAIEIYRAMKAVIFSKSPYFVQAQANWKRFWELIKSPSVSYLMACAAEVSFQRVRHVVLDTLWRVYRIGTTSKPQTVETWTTGRVREVLGLDKDSEAVQLCEAYGFQFSSTNGGPTFLDVTAKGFARTQLSLAADLSPQIFSQAIVEKKRHGRAFSAVIQAMTVQQASNNGLLVDSLHQETDEENSLFIPEAPAIQSNPFMKAAETAVATNPFLSFKPTTSESSNTISNPFNKSIEPSSAVAASNPFLSKQTPAAQASAPVTGVGQPGLFDATKNAIKFAPTEASTTPSGSAKSNAFLPAPTLSPAAPTTTTTSAPSTAPFNFFTQPAKASPDKAAATPPPSKSPSFVFPGTSTGSDGGQVSTPTFSFTPAGSPMPPASESQDLKKQKVEEEARRQKAEAESEAQRVRDEQARRAQQAKEVEQQRVEAERQRIYLQEQERQRTLREEQARRKREEDALLARRQARESGYDSLAADVMFDAEEGLMMQFIENLIVNTASKVMAAEEEEKRKKLWEKKQAVADAMYEQRILGLKRLVMASWIAKIEKRKRARQARDRRRRLKEQRAQMDSTLAVQDIPTPAESETTADPVHESAFRKPIVPASARRAKRTEERRGASNSQTNGGVRPSNGTDKLAHQAVTHTALTPVSMSSSQMSNSGYSETYKKNNAPIDRTEGDYFALRAQGYSPSMLRKRNFETASEDDQQEFEPKRPKISPSITQQPIASEPLSTPTVTDYRARFQAIEQRFRTSGGSPQAPNGMASFNGRSSLNNVTIMEQAEQALGRSRSTRASPSKVQHDYGQSVPNLHRRAASLQHLTLGKSTSSVGMKPHAAYWYRQSRFVPQSLYGQGPDAIRAYRQKYGLSSPANSRPNSTEPLALSSPMPIQQSYKPVNGYTQEEYSDEEEASGVEIIDVDADEDNATTTEEEYEGDEESDEMEDEDDEQPSHNRQPQHAKTYDEDEDSPLDEEDGIEYEEDYADGQYAEEAFEGYEGYTDDSGSGISDSQPVHQPMPASKPQPNTKMGGNTEDDAIELSD